MDVHRATGHFLAMAGNTSTGSYRGGRLDALHIWTTVATPRRSPPKP